MALSDYMELFAYGKEHNLTIGGFNTINMEMVQAVAAAAEERETPLIIQCYHHHLNYCGADYISALTHTAANNASVKLALGLDHGQRFEQAKICIEKGFSGVMIDLSGADYDSNVKETRRVVEYAHARGVSVEAELGTIMDGDATLEQIAAGYTDPEMAGRFVADTGVDCLAVSIGTAHGSYTHKPQINFLLLKELVDSVACPIVVHGGSGTPDADIEEMVRIGIGKLNVGTDLMQAYTSALHRVLNEGGPTMDPVALMSEARQAVKQAALRILDLLIRFRV